jgi:Virulence-associated protein E
MTDHANAMTEEQHIVPESNARVREYLNGLVWDGEPRIELELPFAPGFKNCPENTIASTASALRTILDAAVRRAYEPGCAVDQHVVLVGPPACGKSLFVRDLGRCGEFYTETLCWGHPHKNLSGSWIVELSDGLEGLDLKSLLTSTRFAVQRSHAQTTDTALWAGIVVLTTNVQPRDMGDRRLRCLHICEPVTFNVNQVWAEAVARYKAIFTGRNAWMAAFDKAVGRYQEVVGTRPAVEASAPVPDVSEKDSLESMLGQIIHEWWYGLTISDQNKIEFISDLDIARTVLKIPDIELLRLPSGFDTDMACAMPQIGFKRVCLANSSGRRVLGWSRSDRP